MTSAINDESAAGIDRVGLLPFLGREWNEGEAAEGEES